MIYYCSWHIHACLCRRAERLQHPPGVSLSRGGGLPEDDPRGAARSGPQEHPGPGPTPAVRRLHVHVPEPDHEPVQVEPSPQKSQPLHSWPSATPTPLPPQGRRFPERPKNTKINWEKKGCLPAGVLSGVNPLHPTFPQCLPISGSCGDARKRGRSLFALCISSNVVFFM